MSHFANLFNHAISLHHSGKLEAAISFYLKALPLQRDNGELLFTIGTAYCQLGKLEEGLNYLRKSSRANPRNFHTFGNIGRVLTDLHRYDEAILNYNKAIALNQNFPEALLGRANALVESRRYNEAILDYDRITSLAPKFPLAHCNKGRALFELENYGAALSCYNQAILLAPNFAEAYSNRGNAHKKLNNLNAALTDFTTAIQLNPNLAGLYSNRGFLLQELNRHEEALPDLEKAYALNPDIDCLFGAKLHAHMHLCDWQSFYIDLEELKRRIQQSANVSAPFVIHGVLDSPSLQRSSTEIFVKNKYPTEHQVSFEHHRSTQQTINIGYFSSDFRNHPVTHLLAGLFEAHDRSRFKITAFSLSAQVNDTWRERVAGAVDAFVDIQDKTDADIASLARSLDIDIAIDLNGHTMHARPGIFAHRAAPIQASYIGFLGTSGAPYFDYLIADPFLIPEDMQDFYSEKIVYLPSYQCNDKKVDISDKIFDRGDFGLPTDAFVFCSFNSNYKITPPTYDSWMKILKLVDGSVLWIYVDNETAKTNFRKEAAHRGVDPDRLIFANKLPLNEHLARQRLADLFLDTYPYNAGATATNALRVGLPLITRSGDSFASRYGASILNAVGVPELITNSAESFESLAVELARNRQLYTSIKEKLHQSLPDCTLYDTQRFAKSIEAAFSQMHQRLCNNLNPENIYA